MQMMLIFSVLVKCNQRGFCTETKAMCGLTAIRIRTEIYFVGKESILYFVQNIKFNRNFSVISVLGSFVSFHHCCHRCFVKLTNHWKMGARKKRFVGESMLCSFDERSSSLFWKCYSLQTSFWAVMTNNSWCLLHAKFFCQGVVEPVGRSQFPLVYI